MSFRFSSVLRINHRPLFEDVCLKLAQCTSYQINRLEFIGTSFLKFCISEYGYFTYPKMSAGNLSKMREQLINDSKLAKFGKEYDIDRMMCTMDWVPNEYKIISCKEKDVTKIVNDQQIAYYTRALMGKYLILHEFWEAKNFMESLGYRVLTNKTNNTKICENQNQEIIVDKIFREKNFKKLENQIQYRFNDKKVLIEAFRHSSYKINGNFEDYERKEFFGDSVLDYLISIKLYDYNLYDKKMMNDIRSRITNNIALASITEKYGLDKFFLCTDTENPKRHADIFESLVAAIYIDSNRDFGITWKVLFNLIGPLISEAINETSLMPILKLKECYPPSRVQYSNNDYHDFVTKLIYVDINPITGYGNTKMNATIDAAKRALKSFEQKMKIG